MKKNKTVIFLTLGFLVGVSILLYPAISDFWNSKTQSHAITDYESVLKDLDDEDYTALFEQAYAYNRYGYVLEDGTFIDDKFVEFLELEGFDYYFDSASEYGDLYYIKTDGEMRVRSLATAEDKFIAKIGDIYGILFLTDNYIYYLSHNDIVRRVPIDGGESEFISSSKFTK